MWMSCNNFREKNHANSSNLMLNDHYHHDEKFFLKITLNFDHESSKLNEIKNRGCRFTKKNIESSSIIICHCYS